MELVFPASFLSWKVVLVLLSGVFIMNLFHSRSCSGHSLPGRSFPGSPPPPFGTMCVILAWNNRELILPLFSGPAGKIPSFSIPYTAPRLDGGCSGGGFGNNMQYPPFFFVLAKSILPSVHKLPLSRTCSTFCVASSPFFSPPHNKARITLITRLFLSLAVERRIKQISSGDVLH